MSKRQRIGNRYVSRRKDGTFSKNVNVGRSLSADRRNNAKKTVKAGYGDKGDIKRAEESCPKCKAAVSMDTTMLDTYYLCGDCDIAWYDGGRDNPITIREFQWIQNNPIQHYGVSREEVEELYGKDSNYINYEGEEFGAESKFDKLSNEIAKEYEKKGKSKEEADKIGNATAYKIGVAKYGKRGMERKARAGGIGRISDAEEFGADDMSFRGTTIDSMIQQLERFKMSSYLKGNTPIRLRTNQGYSGTGITNPQLFTYGTTIDMLRRNSDESVNDRTTIEETMESDPDNIVEVLGMGNGNGEYVESYGAESFGADMSDCPDCGGNMGGGGCYGCGYGMESQAWLQLFGADYTTVQRPHHVARVRNDRIGGGKHGLEQWNQPTMHTDQNKLGKMYDEEKGGWVQMDDKARSMFEEIGGKISDFDVVGTAQDVVGKTGLKIPTGIASLAVVWVAYMTGKRYSN